MRAYIQALHGRPWNEECSVTTDGKPLLIEMNDGMAIGCYGLDSVLYAKFLTTRWTELVSGTDPFA